MGSGVGDNVGFGVGLSADGGFKPKLKAGVASGKIVLIKGSYKLSAAERAI